jgi:hypothetical protein
MGDKSPKSKNKAQKQKDHARTEDAAAARVKQDGQRLNPLTAPKGKK